jgi:hypothetical protein
MKAPPSPTEIKRLLKVQAEAARLVNMVESGETECVCDDVDHARWCPIRRLKKLLPSSAPEVPHAR